MLLFAQKQNGGPNLLQPRRPGGHDHPLLRGALCDNGHLVHRPLHHALRLPLQEGSQPPAQSATVPKAAHRESQVSEDLNIYGLQNKGFQRYSSINTVYYINL